MSVKNSGRQTLNNSSNNGMLSDSTLSSNTLSNDTPANNASSCNSFNDSTFNNFRLSNTTFKNTTLNNDSQPTTYLFCHGFGFKNDYWDNFIKVCDENSALHQPFFADPAPIYEFLDENFELDERKKYIGIGHSLGFLKLNNLKIQNPTMNLKALVGLQGFLNFCGTDPVKKKIRQRNLDKMIKIFSKDPVNALNFFWKACGYPKECAFPSSDSFFDSFPDLSQNKLISDLGLMKESFDHCSVPTLIIGSSDDSIVEPSVLLDNFGRKSADKADKKEGEEEKSGKKEDKSDKMASLIHLDFVSGVSHILGFAKSRETFETIQAFLKNICGKC